MVADLHVRTVGATSVATSGSKYTAKGLQWFAMLGAIILTTVQIQDLEDVDGDKARGRRTGPLVLGDRPCRWTIAILVPLWTMEASFFWGVWAWHTVVCTILGGCVAWRVLNRTEVGHDKVTFRVWNVWLVSLYVLPLLAASGRIA